MKGYIWAIGDGRMAIWGTHNMEVIARATAGYYEDVLPDERLDAIASLKEVPHVLRGWMHKDRESEIPPPPATDWAIGMYKSTDPDVVPIAIFMYDGLGIL